MKKGKKKQTILGNEMVKALREFLEGKEVRIIDVERVETSDGPMHIRRSLDYDLQA